MNAIQVQCGHCKRRFAAKPHLAGKRVKCPGCKNPIVIPEAGVITSVEVTCRSCSADFLAESSDVGQRVACPSCGTLTRVEAGQADVSFSAGDPLFDAVPAGKTRTPSAAHATSAGRLHGAAAPLENTPFAAPSRNTLSGNALLGKSGSSLLVEYWSVGAVLLVSLTSLVLCLASGHVLIGAVLLMIGLAVAGSGFVFPSPQQGKASGNTPMVVALAAGGVLVVAALVIVLVGGSAVRGAPPQQATGLMVVVLLELLVLSGAMILFVFMVVRFGIARAASVIYGGGGIVLSLALLMASPAADAGPRRGSVAGGPGHGPSAPSVSRPRGSASEGKTAGQAQPPKALSPASLPSLGLARTIAPGVDFYEVRLRVPRSQPGHASKLYVYVPQGSNAPKSLPCIFIAGAGAYPFTGMVLAKADQPEHIPYAQAGFVVVAYEIDGHLADFEKASNAQFVQAISDYRASDAGMVNARNAIEFALARVSAVDPQRLYTAGHSSAATEALLLAERDPRIHACIAYAPVVDLAKHLASDLHIYRGLISDFDSLLKLASPKSQESRLRCPLFLFHARDDDNVPISESIGLANRLKDAGRVVELVTVSRGGHYESMISEGIPRAIKWLRNIAGMNSTTTIAATGPKANDSTDAQPSRVGMSGFEADPFAESTGPADRGGTKKSGEESADTTTADSSGESPFKPSTKDEGSSGKAMAADSGSDTSPFESSPFGDAKPGLSSTENMSSSISERRVKRLLDKIASGSGFERRDAIKELGQIDPESVESEETRKAIVDQLHDLVVGDDHFTQVEAVKALGKWADSSSVNVLLSVLADKRNRGLNKDIYQVLGRLKDPAAALVVAERLGDFFDHDAAESCLRKMGPVAEDALILVAPTTKKDLCLRAVKLLGDVGSEKCFSVLRQAQRARDIEIREAGKLALKKIRLRQKTEASKKSDGDS